MKELRGVTIAGSGPAGISLAWGLLKRGVSVSMIPGGSWSESEGDSGRKQGANHSADWPHEPLSSHRRFAVGGAGNLWGGRCVLMDKMDFEERPWVPNSGWPIEISEYMRWLPEACELLRITWPDHLRARNSMWGATNSQPSALSESSFEVWSPVTKFSDVVKNHLIPHPNFRLLADSWLENTIFTASGRADYIAVRTSETIEKYKIETLVLAMGTIENTRFLLGTDFAAKLPALGRYYMSHLWFCSPQFAGASLDPSVNFFKVGNTFARRRWTLTKESQEHFQTGNAAAFTSREPENSTNMHLTPEGAAIRLRQNLLTWWSIRDNQENVLKKEKLIELISADATSVVVALPRLIFQFITRRLTPKARRKPLIVPGNKNPPWTMWVQAEHFPNPHSRISLSDELDEFGYPKVKAEIAFKQDDFISAARIHTLLVETIKSEGRKVVRKDFDNQSQITTRTREDFNSNAHQAGTTRMGSNLKTSVVDKDLLLHGSSNTYVAGASVFPTFGHANPTLSIVMLSLRLAEKLARPKGKTGTT